MTTTFHAIVLALGLLAIWAWLTVSLLKIKFGVVVNERAAHRFHLETKTTKLIMYLMLWSSLGLLVGCWIRIIRGV